MERKRRQQSQRCAPTLPGEPASLGGGVSLPSLLLGVVNGDVDEASVLGLLGRGEDEGRVGGGVLGLVDSNG